MNVKKYVRALLCLYLTLIIAMDAVKAQTLKVGDTLPQELWSMPLDVINHAEGKDCITLADYKDKLIILDFWATWCAPCIAMLPKQDSLQRQFKDRLQILPVTYQTGEEVSTFMEKYEKRKGVKNSLPKVVGDKVLRAAFPHTYLPHYVWIDVNGTVKAITGHQDINAEKITAFLSDANPLLSIKTDPVRIPYDESKPFLINGNGGDGSSLLYHSVLNGYTAGLVSGYSIATSYPDKPKKITGINLSLLSLYRLAFGEGIRHFGNNRTIIHENILHELRPRTSEESYADWLESGNGYCFEIIVPHTADIAPFRLMQRSLLENFPRYHAQVEKKIQRSLVLMRTSDIDKIKTSGGVSKVEIDGLSCTINNASLVELTGRLAAAYMQFSSLPIVDGTGYTGNVDLDFVADLSSKEAVNAGLKKYDLMLTEADFELEMLVIRSNR